MNKKEALEALHKKFATNNKCPLKQGATQAVYGAGDSSAEILFIGEAPGKQEDITGTPFVGAAGKFLDEMLTSIQLTREVVYITNVVKYRPPNNRDPLPEEVAPCKEWLLAEIKLVNPRLIVTLGHHALSHFIPNKKISAVHGQVFQKNIPGLDTCNFYVLYHPAAALYNGSLRETLKKDFQRIPKIIRDLNTA